MTRARTQDESRRDRPRRDADGRLATIGDLLGVAGAGLVLGFAVLLVVEAVTALVRLSTFGTASGWLTLVLPAWLFAEDFRAAPYGAGRVMVALLAAAVGVAAGMTVAGLVTGLPPLLGGAVGAVVLTVVYAVIWFYGLRWLSRRTG